MLVYMDKMNPVFNVQGYFCGFFRNVIEASKKCNI